MLSEIRCDKFKSYGGPRSTIRFHLGLNAVIGDDNGSNSIGKSTFLMILDFVFGGTDYVKKCSDVHANVHDHTINFAFDFEGTKYYFARNTVDYNHVIRCSRDYKPLPNQKPLSIEEYGRFLCGHYGLNAEGITWRGAVSRFIRVYKRDTLDEERPLRAAKDERAEGALKSYMRLFDRYATVAAQIKRAGNAEEEKEAFQKATQKYSLVRAARNVKDREANEERIATLECRERELAESSNHGLLDLDSVTARRIAELNEALIGYRRQRARVQTQLNAVRRDMTEQRKGFKKTFTDLERFFPNEDFRTLEEIERFHARLAKILSKEFAETEQSLEATYALLSNEIARIEEQITEEKNVPNVSLAILREYAEINRQLNNLRDANNNFDKLEELKQTAAELTQKRDEVIREELQAIDATVNQAMREITTVILKDEMHMSPILHIERLNKYTFSTPNDGGTGAQYRGLITFDLANMQVAPVPFIVHDSVVLKHIERSVFSRIIEVYDSQKAFGKQVFMSYDTLDSYGKETRKLIESNAVLELSPGGNELFGWAWNKVDPGAKESAEESLVDDEDIENGEE